MIIDLLIYRSEKLDPNEERKDYIEFVALSSVK